MCLSYITLSLFLTYHNFFVDHFNHLQCHKILILSSWLLHNSRSLSYNYMHATGGLIPSEEYTRTHWEVYILHLHSTFYIFTYLLFEHGMMCWWHVLGHCSYWCRLHFFQHSKQKVYQPSYQNIVNKISGFQRENFPKLTTYKH